MKQTLDFYRVLGLDIPESANEEMHVEVNQGGVRLAFDTVDSLGTQYGVSVMLL